MSFYYSLFIIALLGLCTVSVLADPSGSHPTTERPPRRLCAQDIVRRMNALCLGCTKPTRRKLTPIGGGEPIIDAKVLEAAIAEHLSTPVPGRLNLRGTLTDICCKQAKCHDEFLLEFCCSTRERAMLRSGGTTSAP